MDGGAHLKPLNQVKAAPLLALPHLERVRWTIKWCPGQESHSARIVLIALGKVGSLFPMCPQMCPQRVKVHAFSRVRESRQTRRRAMRAEW